MVEPEVAFMDLDGDMHLAEDFLAFIVARVLETRREELKVLERDTASARAREGALPAHHVRARRSSILQKNGHPEAKVGDDFGGDEETVISAKFDRPVIVHRYPMDAEGVLLQARPERRPRSRSTWTCSRPRATARSSAAVSARTISRRSRRRSTSHKLPREAFEWYLDLRRYGTFPHAGFGLGIERTVAWICGLPHVRETIPFPRMLNRLSP